MKKLPLTRAYILSSAHCCEREEKLISVKLRRLLVITMYYTFFIDTSSIHFHILKAKNLFLTLAETHQFFLVDEEIVIGKKILSITRIPKVKLFTTFIILVCCHQKRKSASLFKISIFVKSNQPKH